MISAHYGRSQLIRRFRFLLVLASLQLLLSLGLPAQITDLAQQSDDQRVEEQWLQMKAEQGESHASGMRPELGPVIVGNPTQSVVVVRIGLYYSYTATGAYSEFSSLNHPFAEISNTVGTVHVLDEGTGKQIVAIEAGQIVHISYDGTGYQISLDGAPLGTFVGPVFFRPTDGTNLFRVESINRTFGKQQVPIYRGAIEVSRGIATAANRVNVVNVVQLEDYVPGVVVNESISSFGIEALKAQAVAARGYAVANVGRYIGLGYPFDIVDSSSSQVYRGVISEHVKAIQASTETTGLVASYDGKIISALYSSSFGGHSESNEWIFNVPSNQLPGTNITPYLHGIYDGDGTIPDFSTDSGVSDFWTVSQPTTYDDCIRVGNRFSRWKLVLTADQLKSRLTGSRIVVVSGDTSGKITDVQITSRMGTSGRAAVVRITLTSGVIEVRGWDNLRNVIGRTAVSTPAMCPATAIAANFTLNNPSVLQQTKNVDDTLNQLTVWGGGWGHNVGLSQYGSNGRAKAGQNFLEILKAYYTGVDIGSYPIDIGRNPGTGTPTLRQQFYAPNAKGTLVVRPIDLKGLRVHINGTYDISLDSDALSTSPVSVDLSQYLVPGLNTIQYNPVGQNGKVTVTVVVE
jgi:SpoIID/LytB domain protein